MRKRTAFLFMMGDSRLCSHADENHRVERKRGIGIGVRAVEL